MLEKTPRTSLLLLIGAACFVPMAFADCPQTTAPAGTACMDLTSPGYGGYQDPFGGVYVGPYTATINGTSTAVICDDYLDESYIPEYWTADIINGSSGVTGSTPNLTTTRDAQRANGTDTPALSGTPLQKAYDEVGYLALQLLNTAPSDVATMGVIHFALWSVFDPAALNDLNSSDAKAAGIQLGYAVSAVNGDAGSNYSKYISQFTIYSPDSAYQVCTTACGVAPPQEFLVRTPEPPFFALLGVDFSGLGALIFLIRRRSARS